MLDLARLMLLDRMPDPAGRSTQMKQRTVRIQAQPLKKIEQFLITSREIYAL